MEIIDIQLSHLSIPLKAPFKTALRSVAQVEDVLVRVHTDAGNVGYGSAAPTPSITGDTRESIQAAIKGSISETLLGLSVENFEEVMSRLHAPAVRNSSAEAAVDIALYDLYGQLMRVPVYRLLGGSRRKLITDVTISINEPDEMVRDCMDAVRRGFKTLKVKVGSDPEKDVIRLKRIREKVGQDVTLRVDANQGWSPQEAVYFMGELESAGVRIELLEQPVKGDDLKGLKFVTEHTSVPVVADESAFSVRDVYEIIQMGAADQINIKLMKTGGIYNALKICAMAERARMECMIGCMMESRISVTAAAHLASARSVITRCDLDAPILCREDPVEGGALYRDDHIILSDEPGLGFVHIKE